MIIKRKTITRRGGGGGAGTGGGEVKSVAVGDSTYNPDADGQVTLPNYVQAVKINGSTHAPNSSGVADLGNVGGGGISDVKLNGSSVVSGGVAEVNASTAVTINETAHSVDANGNVAIGNYCQSLKINNIIYNVSPTGEIDLGHISSMNGIQIRGYEVILNTYKLCCWQVNFAARFRDVEFTLYDNNYDSGAASSSDKHDYIGRMLMDSYHITTYLPNDFPTGIFMLVDRAGVMNWTQNDGYYYYIFIAYPQNMITLGYPYYTVQANAGYFIRTMMEGQLSRYLPSTVPFQNYWNNRTLDLTYLSTYGIELQGGVRQLDFSSLNLPI